MKYVEPSYEIISCPDNALEMIEKTARTCYKSEDKIGDREKTEMFVRKLLESGHLPMIEFGGDLHVKFISNRGFTHELVRHRLASYAQESTRYCNYSKGKFGGEISNIPGENMVQEFNNYKAYEMYLLGLDACFRFCEEWYLKLINSGVPPQLAREVLNIGVKAEIHIKANFTEWRHIFKMRTSNRAHPRMHELMIPLLFDVQKRVPYIFDDIVMDLTK